LYKYFIGVGHRSKKYWSKKENWSPNYRGVGAS
jgi:hypothetical protein